VAAAADVETPAANADFRRDDGGVFHRAEAEFKNIGRHLLAYERP
jgi:hypothetical protein